ncbi:MAG: lipopolysaccharide kinase InaA family protein [Gemmataceae bacterium]|nr:lipopolysaccharide kinase InaA family protein [Gemmataceae bacterium]
MAFVCVQPECQDWLRGLGLVHADDFLRLDGVILSGHPDRHVLQVQFDRLFTFRARSEPAEYTTVILKKEHRIRLRDRSTNAWHGFGWVSKSTREAILLNALTAAGITCPRVLAHGASGGRAFLLLREETKGTDLRLALHEGQEGPARRALLESLGKEIARFHAAGFVHRDLYAKHIFVRQEDREHGFCFLDWQRARRLTRVRLTRRVEDLATLLASLSPELVDQDDRDALMHAYWPVGPFGNVARGRFFRLVLEQCHRLLKQHRLRQMHRPPLPAGQQNLVWLDGEALVVTTAFRQDFEVLASEHLQRPDSPVIEDRALPLSGKRVGQLTRRLTRGFWPWLLSFWKKPTPPEMEQAITLFRLERQGVLAPRLLAFGHRLDVHAQFSFVLSEKPVATSTLRDLLCSSTSRKLRDFYRLGRLLRSVHEAGYSLRSLAANWEECVARTADTGDWALLSLSPLQRNKAPWRQLAARDLALLRQRFEQSCRKLESLAFALGYRQPHTSPTRKRGTLARRVQRATLARRASEGH